MTAFIIMGLAAPVFGQNSDDEARKHLVRGMAAVEMAKNDAGLTAAAAEFKKATELAPTMAAAWYNLGSVQSKMGQLKEAIVSYRRYLILAPKADDARMVNDAIIKLEYRLEQGDKSEIKRDGHFIAYDNGTVLDTRTNLMWAGQDNGRNINWANAKSYCENYRGGGYTDWRMPTQAELSGLFDRGKTQENESDPEFSPLHLTELIDLTNRDVWASKTRTVFLSEDHADTLGFSSEYPNSNYFPQSIDKSMRALPVRNAK
jgi:tetratricopeptide (TPR) repeat protein